MSELGLCETEYRLTGGYVRWKKRPKQPGHSRWSGASAQKPAKPKPEKQNKSLRILTPAEVLAKLKASRNQQENESEETEPA